MKIDILSEQLKRLLDAGAADIEFRIAVRFKNAKADYVVTTVHNNITVSDANSLSTTDHPIWETLGEHIAKKTSAEVAAEIRKANK